MENQMDINEMKLKDVMNLAQCLGAKANSSSMKEGKAYLIRCVTHYYTGRIKTITDTDILLEDAAWIADTGRFNECLKNGTFNEVEPFEDDVIIRHPLPRAVK
jgi:hypothetical protein